MPRIGRRLGCLLAALLGAGGAAFALALGAGAKPATPPAPNPAQGACPRLTMQPLPGDAVARASLAALDQARAVYGGLERKGMRVTRAALAPDDRTPRGAYARAKCGRAAQRRTVVVYLEFPAMRPSASLSQGVVLVSRFAGAYRVWARLH
jgi:hypothetical protein